MKKLLYICDWLPPDFGAVGQYSLGFARQRAAAGDDVVLAGLSSTSEWAEVEHLGAGRLTVLRFKAETYDRGDLRRRAWWTTKVNLRLLWRLRRHLWGADEVLFTGSPPFLLHFLAPLNVLLRKRLVYRITDFHPECLMAGRDRVRLPLKAFHRLTVAWRKTIGRFEVLGEDQRRRLLEIGIPADRIELKRDPSPVEVRPETMPLERPGSLAGYAVLLYSGNFGVAHDHETFIDGYRLHHIQGTGRVGLWLNATGAKADLVERLLRDAGLPVHRSRPVPLDELSRLLVTPDAHLITLRDAFVGYVLPSKVYGSIESGCDVLYVGSAESDVHLLCHEALPPTAYHQVPTGRPDLVAAALEFLADRALGPVGRTSGRRGRLAVGAGSSEQSHFAGYTDR
ncbi:MAG TPA: hypothetical protein VNH11_22945 [Pirellulales bacterium]|nr:hypothetical protein [Pirellulales bacterium]